MSLRRLKLSNFKSFREQELRFSEWTLLYGSNAVGKSNIHDALWLLQRLAAGEGTLEDLLEGSPDDSGGSLRGGASAAFHGLSENLALEVDLLLKPGPVRYRVELTRKGHSPRLLREMLRHDRKTCFDIRWQNRGSNSPTGFPADRSVLHSARRLEEPARSIAEAVRQFLARIRVFHFDPEVIRRPCRPDAAHLGIRGENTAACLQRLWLDTASHRIARSWLEELIPDDVTDLRFVVDGRKQLSFELVGPNNLTLPGASASDGTLRFLALLALTLDDADGCCFLEELENGVHPKRVHLQLELLRAAALRHGQFQVICSTHSSALLDQLGPDNWGSVYLLTRRDGATQVVRLSDVPGIENARAEEALSVLHGTGWFEQAIFFSEPETCP